MDGPEPVKCIYRSGEHRGSYQGATAWCGQAIFGFCFTDIEHALLNGEQGGRLLLCPDCEAAICVSLRTASSGEKPVDVERMDDLERRWIGPSYDSEVDRSLSAEELAELQDLKRRFGARYREPSTLPPEVRGEIDRILSGKKMRAEEYVSIQAGQREISEHRTLRAVLARISEQIRESRGEDYDEQLGISTTAFKLLEAAWNEHEIERGDKS